MFYRFLKNLRSKKSAQSKKRSPQKLNKFWQSPAWKIGIGLSAVVLLITVVLFNKQIDNLLRLWGIKANEMGWVTVTVDPNINNVYPNQAPPANIAEYNLTISPEQGDLWMIDPETEGLTRIEIDKINIFHSPLTIDPYIDNMILDNKGTPVNFDFAKNQFDLSSNPIVFSNTDPNPDLPQTFRLTIITKPGIPPLISDIRGTFDVAVSGIFEEIRAEGEMGIGTVVSYPTGFILNFLAAGALPDFSLEITSPVDKGQSEIITAGNDANYTITVTAINGFRGPVNLQHAGFTDYMPPIGDVITGVDLPASVDIDDDTPHDVALVVHTNTALGAPVDINFTIIGVDVIGNTRSDSGILHIIPAPPAPDFRITAIPLTTVSRDELLRYVTYPGGQVQYSTTVLRENWGGVVEANVVWLDAIAATRDIDRVEFNNGGHFTDGSTQEPTVLTIYTKTTATPEDLTFYVRGLGDLDGIDPLEERRTEMLTFSIMDFSIALSPLNQTVGDKETANYLIQLTPLNRFNGTIRFSVIPNSPTDYQNYIAAERFEFSDYTWHAIDADPIINLSIDTKAYDPGNPLPYPKDILFRVRATVLLPFTGLEHDSNETTLTITINPDFTITFKPLPVTSDELGRQITYPGGQLTFEVIVNRLNSFTGDVRAEVVWKDPIGAALAIDQVIFGNGGNFTGGTIFEETTVTIVTKTTAPSKDYGLYINGYGDINGDAIEEIRRTAAVTISIVDFGIVIYGPLPLPSDPNVTVSAGGVARYNLQITGSNFFNGMISLSIDPDFAATYPQHIVKNPEFTSVTMTVDSQYSPLIPFNIQTQPTSPGTGPSGLPFRIKGINTNRFPISLERWSNEGQLHIVTTQDFSIDLIFVSSAEQPTEMAWPGGTIKYQVILTRLNDWAGAVNLTHNLIIGWPSEIASVVFANGGTFPAASGDDSTQMTITIKTTASAIRVNGFSVFGTGNVGGVDVTRSASATFDIINFTVTVTPEPPHNGETMAGEVHDDIIYRVTLTPLNKYTGIVWLDTNLKTNPAWAGDIDSFWFDAPNLNVTSTTQPFTFLHIKTLITISEKDIVFTVTGEDRDRHLADGITHLTNIGNALLRVLPSSGNPAFTIAVMPASRTVTPGGSTTYTVTIYPVDNFRGTVNLNHNLIHQAVDSALFDSNSLVVTDADLNPWTTLRVQTNTSVYPIGIPFTVMGVSNDYGTPITATSNDAYLFITNLPNFELYITPTERTVQPGQTADYTVYITRSGGFGGDVNLSTNVGSFAGIANYSFDDNPLTFGNDSTTLHVSAISPFNNATINFEVRGSGAPGVRTVSATLYIVNVIQPSFSILIDPDTRTVAPGGSTSYDVIVTPSGGFVGRIDLTHNLSHSSIQSAILEDNYLIFNAGDIQLSTRLNVVILPAVPDVTIYFTVHGDETTGPLEATSNQAALIITNQPDFALILVPSENSGFPGERVNYTLNLTRLNGFTGNVTAFITTDKPGLIANITIENNGIFDATTGDDLLVSITTMANAIAQDILITAHGTAAGIVGERTDNAILHIVDFVIYVTPEHLQGRRGSIVTYLVKLVRNNNFDRAINLSTSLTGNINLSDVSFANGGIFPAQVGGSQETNLNVEIAPNASLISIPFTVTGTDLTSAQQREDNAILTIYDVTILMDFTITISPDSRTVEPGGSTAYTITITRLNGHTEDITLTTDLAIKNPNEIESAKFEDSVISVGEDSTILNVKTKDTARNSTDPITFNVWGDTATLNRADFADLIIYKYTGGGGDGGTPVTPPTPPVVPPAVEPPKKEPEIQIPEALPSTGPDAWLWLVVTALLAISIPGSIPKKKRRAKS